MASVRIRWFGHSGFSIRDGKTVLIDPWFEGNPKAPGGAGAAPKADLMLLTHDRVDHGGDAVALARKTGPLVVGIFELAGDLKAKGVPEAQLLHGGGGMNVGGTVTVQGFGITMTEARHSCTLGAPVGYVLKTPSGLTIYHSGDTGIFAGMSLIGELDSIDVALLPIGSVFTMDYRQAAKAGAPPRGGRRGGQWGAGAGVGGCAAGGATTGAPPSEATQPKRESRSRNY